LKKNETFIRTQNPLDFSVIYIPVRCTRRYHFLLLRVIINLKRIEIWDSLRLKDREDENGEMQIDDEYTEIVDCLKKHYLRDFDVYWEVSVMNGPQQKPGSLNCGPLTCLAMRHLIFNERFEDSLIHPRSKIRNKIGEELIGNALSL
jgi:hypothetical protein